MIANTKRNKIAILYICTGKYVQFWEDFFKTAEKFLLNDCEKHYFVFTDSPQIYGEQQNHIHKIKVSALVWPYSTLLRFHLFVNVSVRPVVINFLRPTVREYCNQ